MNKTIVFTLVLVLISVPLIAGQQANDTNETNQTQVNETNETNETQTNETINATNETQTNETVNETVNETNETIPEEEESQIEVVVNETNETTEEEDTFEVNETSEWNDTAPTVDEDVDTVIVASTENFPDAMTAATAADRYGIPVLLTENDAVSESVNESLEQMNPSDVVIAGGPAVIDPSVDEELNAAGYDTTRLWGLTQYGTATDMAEYFWMEGADEAVVVQQDRFDQNFSTLAAAKEHAQREDAPLYLTPEGEFPAMVLSSLQTLGVDEVTLVGTNVTDDYRSTLTDADIDVTTEYVAEDSVRVSDELLEATFDETGATDEVAVVASEDYHHATAAARYPETSTVHITDEGQVDTVADRIEDIGTSRITVIGSSELAPTTANQLGEQTDATIDLLSAPADQAVQLNAILVRQHLDRFVQESQDWLDEQGQLIEDRESSVRLRTALTVAQADSLVTENASEQAQDFLDTAQTALEDEDYLSSRTAAYRAISVVRLERYQEIVGTDELEQEIERELQSLSMFRQQAEGISSEFGTAFADAPLEEQIVVLQFLEDMPEEQYQLTIRETAEVEEDTFLDRFETARQRVEEGNTTVNETETADELTTNQSVIEENATTNETDNETTINETNDTAVNTTNDTTENLTANDTNETENESGVTLPGENEAMTVDHNFTFDTRCLTGDATSNHSIQAVGQNITANGSVVLPTPNYNATSNVTLDNETNQVGIAVDFVELDGPGIQCVGEGNFTDRIPVEPGNWTVNLTATVEDEERITAAENVTVESGTNETEDTNDTAAGDESAATQEAVEVSMTDNAFQPDTIEVSQGDSITFVNDGENTHNVNIAGIGFDEDVEPGDSVTVEMDQTGTFELVCNYHQPDMTGEIVVQ